MHQISEGPPRFSTAARTTNLQIVGKGPLWRWFSASGFILFADIPHSSPAIYGLRAVYGVGEWVNLTCEVCMVTMTHGGLWLASEWSLLIGCHTSWPWSPLSTGWALVSPRPPELDHERGQDPARVSAGHQHGPRVPPPRQQGHLQVIHRDRLVWGVRHEVRNKSYIGFINSVSNGWRIVNVNCKWGC